MREKLVGDPFLFLCNHIVRLSTLCPPPVFSAHPPHTPKWTHYAMVAEQKRAGIRPGTWKIARMSIR